MTPRLSATASTAAASPAGSRGRDPSKRLFRWNRVTLTTRAGDENVSHGTGTLRRRLWRWRRAIDRVRIREHLRRAERELRDADVGHLDGDRRRARERQLDRLRSYRRGGSFPRNGEAAERTPCFVGADGVPCALGALLLADGRSDLVADVAARDNAVRIEDCDDERILDWLEENGLTRAEAARIQPSYDVGVHLATDCGRVACSTAGLIAAVVGGAAFAGLEAVGYRLVSDAFPGNVLKRRALLGYATVANLLLAPLAAALVYALFP